MASLFSTAIVAVCVSAQGQYNVACNNALDAGTRQVGIRQDVDMVEDGTIRYVETQAQKKLGNRSLSLVGTGYAAYRINKDKKVKFKLPDIGICNSITNEVTPNSYKVDFQWKF